MKYFFAISAIVAVIAAASGAPAPKDEIDWAALETKVEDIRGFISEAIRDVQKAASDDRSDAGNEIARRIIIYIPKATEIIDAAKDSIRRQAFLKPIAVAFFEVLDKLQNEIKADFANLIIQLNPTTQAEIERVMSLADTRIRSWAIQVYTLIDGSIGP